MLIYLNARMYPSTLGATCANRVVFLHGTHQTLVGFGEKFL
jgi:hypothetical protein